MPIKLVFNDRWMLSAGFRVLLTVINSTVLLVGMLDAAQGEWATESAPRYTPPAKNRRVAQQPRPATAPTGGYNGYAVKLSGRIETIPSARKRPTSNPQPTAKN